MSALSFEIVKLNDQNIQTQFPGNLCCLLRRTLVEKKTCTTKQSHQNGLTGFVDWFQRVGRH